MSKGPTTSTPLFLERLPVAGSCPECGGTNLARYPVNSEGGWFEVVKCQACLHSLERVRAPRLGPITLLSDAIGEPLA